MRPVGQRSRHGKREASAKVNEHEVQMRGVSGLRSYLRTHPRFLQIWSMVAAFACYFCMYAFRKPFSAGSYEGGWGELSYKTLFVIAQIFGYALSKYLGTVIVSGLDPRRRLTVLLTLVGCAWFSLLIFAFSPPVVRAGLLFINGLALGMIWGLVVGYLEGRRSSELLLAGLSCSFIVASGVVKDVGRYLMRSWDVSESWMPFLTAALFVPPLFAAAWMLGQLPPPDEQDRRERSERTAMSGAERRAFLRTFLGPLSLLLLAYFFLTAFRDYRDNYGVELFQSLGYADEPALFTQTELPVAFGVMVVLALLSWVRSNRRALYLVLSVMGGGLLLLSGATWLLQSGLVSGAVWMFLLGLGSYLCYVPFGSVLFDRLMAQSRVAGNAAFGIYLADSVGYTGSIFVQLYAEFFSTTADRLGFFLPFCHTVGLLGALLLAGSGLLLLRPKSSTFQP